ncbi:MAG TPA: DUF6461 domain-containing protein [Nocardioides sp.]|nr:DUF6461 domain-containing protein [Nocardioides sp.]
MDHEWDGERHDQMHDQADDQADEQVDDREEDRVAHYTAIADELDFETLTVLVVAGARAEEVRSVVLAEAAPAEGEDLEDDEVSAYAFVEVDGGVLAMEYTGFADPTVAALTRLSADGRSVAVVRDNISAHLRFGCARDGALLFDDDEFAFIEADDRTRVPDELRPLFDLAWVDLDADDPDEHDDRNPIGVALAMAEAVTGVDLTEEDFERAMSLPRSEWHAVRTLAYGGPAESQG